MQSVHSVLLATHVVAGFTALIAGIVAMVTQKGSVAHRRFGRTYLWAMACVAATALPLAAVRPNLFLFALAIFSFYLAFSGYRLAVRKRGATNRATTLDWCGVALVLASGLGLLAYGLYQFAGGTFQWVPATIFGAIGIAMGLSQVREFRLTTNDTNEWIIGHMIRMLAAYIATFTAFAVTNLTFLPPLIGWVLPTLLGTIGIAFWTRYYRQKLDRGAAKELGV